VTTLASGLKCPTGITVDSTNVYWTEYLGGTVNKVGINGGSVTALSSGGLGPGEMSEDSTSIYWVDSNLGTVNKVVK
jgi:hypothetical protein